MPLRWLVPLKRAIIKLQTKFPGDQPGDDRRLIKTALPLSKTM
jgi:hypothetical protein